MATKKTRKNSTPATETAPKGSPGRPSAFPIGTKTRSRLYKLPLATIAAIETLYDAELADHVEAGGKPSGFTMTAFVAGLLDDAVTARTTARERKATRRKKSAARRKKPAATEIPQDAPAAATSAAN